MTNQHLYNVTYNDKWKCKFNKWNYGLNSTSWNYSCSCVFIPQTLHSILLFFCFLIVFWTRSLPWFIQATLQLRILFLIFTRICCCKKMASCCLHISVALVMFQKTHSQYILFLMILNIFYKYYFGTSQGYIYFMFIFFQEIIVAWWERIKC